MDQEHTPLVLENLWQSRHATWKGKSYLKSVLIAQANSALFLGELFMLPVGVVFSDCNDPSSEYVVVSELPYPGRFFVQKMGEVEAPIHALARAVGSIVAIPDVCPPVTEWKRA